MIIFDLDGTLADCSHRQHFVKKPNEDDKNYDRYFSPDHECSRERREKTILKNKLTGELWKPDWACYHNECDKDIPIEPVIEVAFPELYSGHAEIWSGRCESVRNKTIEWLKNNVCHTDSHYKEFDWNPILKMRPIGDSTPDDQLKEKWLDEYFYSGSDSCPLRWATHDKCCKKVDYVFDSNPDSIAMWRKRGIFVFDVQGKGEE